MKKLLLLLFVCLLIPVRAMAAPPVSVVTRVEILWDHDGQTAQYVYTQPESMSVFLNFLRLLDYRGQADTDPQTLVGNVYRIFVFLSDGQCHRYYLRADRYLSKDQKPWIMVEPTQAARLQSILQQIPQDL